MLDVPGEHMAELLSLDLLQVALVLDGDACFQRNALFDDYGRRFDCRHLLRVVGERRVPSTRLRNNAHQYR
jgi:hypothetical protein